MKKMIKLMWGFAIVVTVLTACSDDDDDVTKDQKILITVDNVTATSAVVKFPEVSGAHNYTINLYTAADGNWEDMDFPSAVDGEVKTDKFNDLSAATEYKVVVEATKNVITEGIVTLGKDSVNFITLAQ